MDTNSRLAPDQIAALCAKRPVRPAEGGGIMTGPVRLSFPVLTAEAKARQKARSKIANPPDKYMATLLFPHKNLSPLMDALRAAVKMHYPNVSDPSVMLDPYNKNHPLKDQGLKVSTKDGGRDPMGDTMAGYVPGFAYMAPKSGNAIPCYQATAGRWTPILPEEIEKVMYGGCWVEAKVVMFKSTTPANPGIALGLQGLWKLADDNSFGGGGGAAATEGGDAGDAFAIEDPNAIVTPSAAPSDTDWG